MSRFTSLLAVLALLPTLALAKRAAPTKIEPVVFEGIRYVAPNDDGRRAYIEAWNVQTSQKLWELTVFTNHIDPKLEEDVQWVFIKKMSVRAGALIVTSERGKTYRIDLKKKSVTPVEWPNKTLRTTRNGGSSSASRFTSPGPVWLISFQPHNLRHHET